MIKVVLWAAISLCFFVSSEMDDRELVPLNSDENSELISSYAN